MEDGFFYYEGALWGFTTLAAGTKGHHRSIRRLFTAVRGRQSREVDLVLQYSKFWSYYGLNEVRRIG